jgi:hypothetical protein
MNPKTIIQQGGARAAGRFDRLLTTRVLKDQSSYYEDCYGTDSRLVLAAKNVLAPGRLLTRARYGQLVPLPTIMTRASAIGSHRLDGGGGEAERLLVELRRNGVARMAVDRETAEHIARAYGASPDPYEPSAHYWRTWVSPTADDVIRNWCLNPVLVATLARYYRAQPYMRDTPAVNVTYPSVTSSEARHLESDYASNWHFDTPNLLSVHLLISDVEPTGTRMLYALRSHKRNRAQLADSDRWYSEEYVRAHYEVMDCAGPAGTAFIFDNNGLHRLEAVKGRFRSTFEMYFTPGNGLISLAERRTLQETESVKLDASIHQELADEDLSQLQRASLAGLRGER